MLVLLSACSKSAGVSGSPSPKATATSATTEVIPTPTAAPPPTINGPYHAGPDADAAIKDCSFGSPSFCFSPEQVQAFYDLNSLYAKGYDGRGMTIMIMVSYGSPTIKDDLHVFDQTFGLPDPPSFQIVSPLKASSPQGRVDAWENETTIDVEWAHAIAPGANIVLLVSQDDLSEGVAGLSQYEQIMTYAMDHHLGQILSLSWGVSEIALEGDPCHQGLGNGQDFIRGFDQQIFQRAANEHITVLNASGDSGPTNPDCNDSYADSQNVSWPGSSPLVTAVGGTRMNLQDDAGNYGSEDVWNDFGGATGGGVSQFYSEPDWQKSLPNQAALKGKRGIPDVSAGADANFPIYHTYDGDSIWEPGKGTSVSAPLWAGIVAIADQMAGKPLGLLNPAFYQLAGKGFHDITAGDNGFNDVTGFSAGPGWDLASGWGTPDAAALLPSLITTVEQLGG